MGGRTSSAVKDRWNAKTYDTITVRFYKGEKEQLQAAAEKEKKSLNAYIREAAIKEMAGK